MFKKFIVASVIVGAIFASYVFAAKSYPVALEQGTVIKVVDGDTIKVSLDTGLKVNVRVLGVDTPEKYKLKTSYIECYGKEASAFVTSTLKPGTKVTLETDSISPAIDRYKRPLRHVYISGTLLSERIIENGYGFSTVFEGYKTDKDTILGLAEARARQANLGVWSHCDGKLIPVTSQK